MTCLEVRRRTCSWGGKTQGEDFVSKDGSRQGNCSGLSNCLISRPLSFSRMSPVGKRAQTFAFEARADKRERRLQPPLPRTTRNCSIQRGPSAPKPPVINGPGGTRTQLAAGVLSCGPTLRRPRPERRIAVCKGPRDRHVDLPTSEASIIPKSKGQSVRDEVVLVHRGHQERR
jgi:hypothetical protein